MQLFILFKFKWIACSCSNMILIYMYMFVHVRFHVHFRQNNCDRALTSYQRLWCRQNGIINSFFKEYLLYNMTQSAFSNIMNSMKLFISLHFFKKKRLQTMLWHHNVRVNAHQRWKQTRNRVCFHLWCELTLALCCHSMVWCPFSWNKM